MSSEQQFSLCTLDHIDIPSKKGFLMVPTGLPQGQRPYGQPK